MKIGFIDYYLDEWHANHYPEWLEKASGGDLHVTHAYALIDSPRGGLTTDAWCERYGAERCDTIEAVIAACDGLIVLSPDNPEMHAQLCALPLKSGKPVYVDKTFAPDIETAKAIMMAASANTPYYTSSALRYAQEYGQAADFTITGISSWGPGTLEIYSIHQIEPIVMLMGEDARRVMCLPGEGAQTLIIEFISGRCATLSCCEAGNPFMMNVFTPAGGQVITVESDYFGAFINDLAQFFRAPSMRVPHQETLRVMGIRGAGIKAAKQPMEWVNL